MAKKNTKRKIVGLVCEETGLRLYYTRKNTQNTTEKLSFLKYNPSVRRRTRFTEVKKNLGRNEVKARKG